jgi:hypothetical protein
VANTGAAGSQDSRALLGELGSAVAPTTAQGQVQYNLGQEQLGLINQNLSTTEAYNQAMSGYQAQNLGLGEQGLGIQQLGLQQQGAQNQAQQGYEQQQYALNQTQYPEQSAEAALAYQNAMQQNQGSQAISGTQNTVGGKQQTSTINQNYGFQQQDIARAQALSQLGQQSEQSGYGYSQQQLSNAQQNLSLNAQANGLSEQQLLTMLNYGQSQAGQGAASSLVQLLSGQGTNALGQVENTGSALSTAGFAGGFNAVAGTLLGGQ